MTETYSEVIEVSSVGKDDSLSPLKRRILIKTSEHENALELLKELEFPPLGKAHRW